MCTTIGTYYSFQLTVCCPAWIGIVSTNCCVHMFVPTDDGPRYDRNMQRLTKYTKNKLCIELVFLYTIMSRCTVKKTLKKPKISKRHKDFKKCANINTGCDVKKHHSQSEMTVISIYHLSQSGMRFVKFLSKTRLTASITGSAVNCTYRKK